LAWPVHEGARVTSPFGERIHPVLGTRKMHTGVDLGVPTGTAVVAVAEGVVRRASEDAVNGRVLVLDHGRGVTTAYCHNSELVVAVGQRVERGQLVARSGNTGRSTGPHLHYQLELAARPMDPLKFRSALRSVARDTTH
ncbi:M23 family metallopeptidase, partial [Pyxidicoccus sp. 3LG]